MQPRNDGVMAHPKLVSQSASRTYPLEDNSFLINASMLEAIGHRQESKLGKRLATTSQRRKLANVSQLKLQIQSGALAKATE